MVSEEKTKYLKVTKDRKHRKNKKDKWPQVISYWCALIL